MLSLCNNIDCTAQIEKETTTVKSKTISTNNKKGNNTIPQKYPEAGTTHVEIISIILNSITERPGRGVYGKPSQHVSQQGSQGVQKN